MNIPILEQLQVRKLALSETCRVRSLRNSEGLWIGYSGTWEALGYLEQVPEARYEPRGHLWLPASRTAVLLLETIGQVEEASDDYLQLRRSLFTPPAHLLENYPEPPPGMPPPMAHQEEAFCYAMEAFLAGGRGYANWSEMGCIAGETMLPLNRAGKGFRCSIADAYQRFHRLESNLSINWRSSIPTFCRALVGDELHQHRVMNILSQGRQACIRLRLESGRQIVLTPDHAVGCPGDQWVPAGDLRVGSPIWANGRFVDQDGYVRVCKMQGHSREQAQSGQVYEHLLVMEAMLGHPVPASMHVHHVNGDRGDNRPENLELLSPAEHQCRHHAYRRLHGAVGGRGGQVWFVPEIDRVSSIETAGLRETYDLVMADPHRNFVANDILVHNCGKTRWAIDVMRAFAERCCLVVAPKSTLEQWAEQITLLWPTVEPIVLAGTLPERAEQITATERLEREGRHDRRQQVLIVNWEAIAPLQRRLTRVPYSITVFDESSRAKNGQTKTSKAAAAIAARSYRRLCLSGTPMANDPTDLWAQYRLLDDHLLGESYGVFAHRYFHLGGHTGKQFESFHPERIAEFVTKLYSIGYRVTKATVAEMPAKLGRTVTLTMLPQQARVYRQVAEQMYAEEALADGRRVKLRVASAMSRVLRLQQICAGIVPYQEVAWRGISITREEMGRNPHALVPSIKTQWTTEWIQESLLSEEVKILVWTRFLPEVRAITAALVQGSRGLTAEQLGFIDGAVDTSERERLRKRFNDRGNPLRVLVCQVQAAAYGMDLPGADVLIYHSHTYSYSDRKQSEDRGHRIGRQRPYQIIDLVCEGSVDVQVLQALRRKQALADLLLQTGGSLRQLLETKTWSEPIGAPE